MTTQATQMFYSLSVDFALYSGLLTSAVFRNQTAALTSDCLVLILGPSVGSDRVRTPIRGASITQIKVNFFALQQYIAMKLQWNHVKLNHVSCFVIITA
jgi:hypothetical protein